MNKNDKEDLILEYCELVIDSLRSSQNVVDSNKIEQIRLALGLNHNQIINAGFSILLK